MNDRNWHVTEFAECGIEGLRTIVAALNASQGSVQSFLDHVPIETLLVRKP